MAFQLLHSIHDTGIVYTVVPFRMDIYGADQTVNVNIGTEEQLRKQNKVTSGCIASKHKFVAWTKLKEMCHKKNMEHVHSTGWMYQCIAVRFNSISSSQYTYTTYVHAYTLCTYNILH